VVSKWTHPSIRPNIYNLSYLPGNVSSARRHIFARARHYSPTFR